MPAPRGCLSALLLIVSGAFAFVFWSIIFLSRASSEAPIPSNLPIAAAASSTLFLFVLFDRIVARAMGVKIRFVQDGQGVRYEVLHRRRILQGDRLKTDRLYVAPLELPGRAGRIFVPTYALLLVLDEDIPGYSVMAEPGPALVLINAADMDVLGARMEEFCSALSLEMNDLVWYSSE
ncbi:MAG: hypothetical protein GY703_11335 [Gammaproteobacteria bacterium]|nr:hypothetical protein [Gammaproteobacteria bacterium]